MNTSGNHVILSRRVDLLFRNQNLGQAVSIIISGTLAVIAYPAIPAVTLALWWSTLSAVSVVRLWHTRRYQALPDQTRLSEAPLWRQRMLLGVTASGLLWALGTLIMTSSGELTLQLFTAFVVAGLTAGAIPVLAADRTLFRVYAWPIMIAVIIGGFGTDSLHIAFTIMTSLALIIFTRGADNFFVTLNETFELEYEKNNLVEKLSHAREIAETSDRAKTEFLGNVSHELRTPMNGILGMADLLEMEELSDDQRSYLRSLRASATDLLHLINQMIELSALESGQIKLSPAPFAPTDLLDSLLNRQTREARAKGLELRLYNDPALPDVLIGDLERLRQVILSLVGNAIKFTEQGHILVKVEIVGEDAGKTWLAFSISDTGPGIAPEKLQQLATGLFVQGDGSIVRRHAGTGIGLPIARKLIELLGGKLEVDSHLGAGSTFRFVLPFERPGD